MYEAQKKLIYEVKKKIHTPLALEKLKTLEELCNISKQARKKDKSVVIAVGAFVIPHFGHSDLFEQAKQQGDILIVAANSDSSVKAIGRYPFVEEYGKIIYITCNQAVDYATLFMQESANEVIKAIKPNVYVKGPDYQTKPVNKEEAAIMKNLNGKIVILQQNYDTSSTDLASRILDYDKRSPLYKNDK